MDQERQVKNKFSDFFRKAPRQYPIISVALVSLILILILWLVPQWQVPEVTDQGFGLKERLHQINENRKTVAQILGGAFFLLGLYFTWKNLVLAQEKYRTDLFMAQEKQATDLFTKAVDQLGDEKLQVRLGGIYALERIARESPKDHWPIMEVLTTFVREIAPSTVPIEKPLTDIQAVLTVLGRTAIDYAKEGEMRSLDLRATHLARASLMKAKLQRALLTKVNLQRAILIEANLQGAILNRANLNGVILEKANLRATIFYGANLQGGRLNKADLRGADLNFADLRGANLRGAEGLNTEQVAEAIWDGTTQWPEGFSPPAPRKEEDNEEK